MKPFESIADLKQKIEDKEGISKQLQTLSWEESQKPLQDSFLFSEFGVATCIDLYLKLSCIITVMDSAGNKAFYKMCPMMPIINLKRATHQGRRGAAYIDDHRLMHHGSRLQDDLSLWDQNVDSGETIYQTTVMTG